MLKLINGECLNEMDKLVNMTGTVAGELRDYGEADMSLDMEDYY